MLEELKAETENEKPEPTPGLSAIIVKRVTAAAEKLLADTFSSPPAITHVAENDSPNWPDTYRVMLSRKLTIAERRDLQKIVKGSGVVGLDWMFFKPIFGNGAGEEKVKDQGIDEQLTPDPQSPIPPDPKDTHIAELEAEIARLKIERQPTIAAAIREEIRAFPSHPEMEAKIEPDINERKLTDYLNSGWEKFDGGFSGNAYNIVFVRARQNSQPEETAKAFVEAPAEAAPETADKGPARSVKASRIIESAVPVVFANLMRANPLIEQVWTRGADAVFDDMMGEAHNRALDFIFARLDAQRLVLELAEGDDNL